MAIARGDNSYLRYIPETTWGTTPTTGVMTPVAIISEGLKFIKTKNPSTSINSHGNVETLIVSPNSLSGPSVHELRYGEFDDIFASALAGTWTSNVLKNARTEQSFSFERGFTDIDVFHLFRGVRANGFNLSVPSDARKVDITFNYVGRDELAPVPTGTDTDWVTTNTNVTLGTNPAATKAPMFLVCGELKINDTAVSTITTFSLDVNRNLGPINTVDCDDPIELARTGLVTVTGTMNGVIEDVTMYNRFINDTVFTLDLQFSDGTSTYTFTMDHVELTDSEQPIGGPNEIVNNSPFQAFYDPTLTSSLQITRAA